MKIKVKNNFEILKGAIVLQEYDEEWEAWLDLENTTSLRHQQRVKCLATADKEEDSVLITEIEKVRFFIHILNLCIFSHIYTDTATYRHSMCLTF